MNYIRNLLEEIGLAGERIRMVNLSAAMGARFAQVATEMVQRIKELGPNPLRERRRQGDKEMGSEGARSGDRPQLNSRLWPVSFDRLRTASDRARGARSGDGGWR